MIRNVTLNDLDAIYGIGAEHQELMSSIDFYDMNKMWLQSHIENHSLFYAYESKGKLLGFILAEKLIGNAILVWTLAVLPEHLNKGIGIKLLMRLERECNHLKKEWIIGYATKSFEKLSSRLGYTTNKFTYVEVVKLLDN